MEFSEVKEVKRYSQSRVQNPGNIYLPSRIREKVDFKVGDDVKLFVNEEEKAVLIKSL